MKRKNKKRKKKKKRVFVSKGIILFKINKIILQIEVILRFFAFFHIFVLLMVNEDIQTHLYHNANQDEG